jgi:hypothetical protein
MTGKAGRPCWSPSEADREKIQTMAALGIQQEKIAAVYEISEKTLRRHCRVELDVGAAVANTAVGKFLFDAATGKGNCPQQGWHDRDPAHRRDLGHDHRGDLLDEDPRPLERDDAA